MSTNLSKLIGLAFRKIKYHFSNIHQNYRVGAKRNIQLVFLSHGWNPHGLISFLTVGEENTVLVSVRLYHRLWRWCQKHAWTHFLHLPEHVWTYSCLSANCNATRNAYGGDRHLPGCVIVVEIPIVELNRMSVKILNDRVLLNWP